PGGLAGGPRGAGRLPGRGRDARPGPGHPGKGRKPAVGGPPARKAGGHLSEGDPTMSRIWAIASNTFREAIRDRILYLLLVLTLLVNTAVMTLWFYLILLLKGFADPRLLLAIALIFLELLLVTAFAILFSSFSTPILSTLFSLALYLVGHLTWSLTLLQDR